MDLLRDNYSFTEFTERWAPELGMDLRDTAVAVAKAIHERSLKFNTDSLSDGAPNDREPTPYCDDVQAQTLDAAIQDHIWRVAEGRERPNDSELLCHVELRRADLEAWFQTMNRPLPSFMRPTVAEDKSLPAGGGEDKFENVHKLVAILAILLADTNPRFKFSCGNNINKSELFLNIEQRLANDQQLKDLLGDGLGRSTVSAVLKRALAPLEPWLQEPKDENIGQS